MNNNLIQLTPYAIVDVTDILRIYNVEGKDALEHVIYESKEDNDTYILATFGDDSTGLETQNIIMGIWDRVKEQSESLIYELGWLYLEHRAIIHYSLLKSVRAEINVKNAGTYQATVHVKLTNGEPFKLITCNGGIEFCQRYVRDIITRINQQLTDIKNYQADNPVYQI